MRREPKVHFGPWNVPTGSDYNERYEFTLFLYNPFILLLVQWITLLAGSQVLVKNNWFNGPYDTFIRPMKRTNIEYLFCYPWIAPNFSKSFWWLKNVF